MNQNDTHFEYPGKLAPFIDERHRYKITYGGRGSAKSWTIARLLLRLGQERPERILCTREIQRTIAESVHQLLSDQISLLGMDGYYNITEHEITGLNGTKFIFAGLRSQDITKLKSLEGVTKCWVEEGQVVSDTSWRVIIPTIRAAGSEIWISMNPELETDPTYVRFIVNTPPNSLAVKMNWSDNPWFSEPLISERLHSKATEDLQTYENIWEGKPRAAVEGAIYASEVVVMFEEKRVRPLPYDPMFKVHLVLDLGWNDKMSIGFFQKVASTLMCIDYIEDSHRTYESYVKEIEAKEYRIGKTFVPHDAKHKDPKFGKSHIDVMEALGLDCHVVPDIGIEAGIKLVRQMLPQMYFSDSEAVEPLIHCLRRYRRQIPQNTNEPGAPMHDEWSHGSDMLRYAAVIAEEMTNEPIRIEDPYRGFESGYAA